VSLYEILKGKAMRRMTKIAGMAVIQAALAVILTGHPWVFNF